MANDCSQSAPKQVGGRWPEEPRQVVVRTVSVATIGLIDGHVLERQLDEVLRAIGHQLASERIVSSRLPSGVMLKQRGAETTLEKETCETAPGFWRWREFQWPEEKQIPVEQTEQSEWKLLAVLAGVCGILGLSVFCASLFGLLPPLGIKLVYAVAILAGGWDAAIDTWENIKERKLDIHFLMLAVAVGAASVGAWSEAALLLFLFSGAGAMEEFALDRTHREVSALLKNAPKKATLLIPNGGEREIPIEQVGIGDRLLVRPGQSFPADAQIVKGKTAVDESNLTGEANPVDKETGAAGFSGTLNLWGAVEIEVSRLPSESTLQRIIRLIQTAQKLKAPSERFTDRFGGGSPLILLGLPGA